MHKRSAIFTTLTLLTLFNAELNAEDFATDLDGFGEQIEQIESFDEEDALDGFSQVQTLATTEQEKPSGVSIGGDLAFKSTYAYRAHSVDGVNYEGFNQAQTALALALEYKLPKNYKLHISGDGYYDAIYDIRSEPYNQDTLNAYHTQLRFDDVYIEGSLSKSLDIKLGRQIVVWGKSDSIRITDVINPMDNRLPGSTDIEDLRLSTTMAKLDYYSGAWNLSAMAIFESRIFLEAAPRGEYFPVDAIFANAPRPFLALQEPTTSPENMQYALALNGLFSGWDISFYAADVFDSKWHLEGSLPNATREVSKIEMLGVAFNAVYGSWLLKSEIASIYGVRYNSTEDAKTRLDALVGADYMGFNKTLLSLEIANRHIFDYESQISGYSAGVIPDYIEEDEVQYALRATRSFLNQRLNATLLLSMFGHKWEHGGFARASFEYDIADAIVVDAGVIEYIAPTDATQKPFAEAISKNDRLFGSITYSF